MHAKRRVCAVIGGLDAESSRKAAGWKPWMEHGARPLVDQPAGCATFEGEVLGGVKRAVPEPAPPLLDSCFASKQLCHATHQGALV